MTLITRYSPYLAGLAECESSNTPFRMPGWEAEDTDSIMAGLRACKRRVALSIATGDLDGAYDDLEVMRQLSSFADDCVTLCLRHLLFRAHAEGKIILPDPAMPEKGCGVTVIALGKWGAHELNYSSDIDFMVIFDAAQSPVVDKDETQKFFIRLTRDLTRMLDAPTGDGYVFRTDLRLRPDPGATPLAVSLSAAETYYGSLGQNWERAAMIKARPVAGDTRTGDGFMDIMRAWIWRKHLDFAAIQDIHSIKRQINARHAHAARKENPFLGFNVKLGHGGIREIEFFAQTQQLIHGGREPQLRVPDTLGALRGLAGAGHISAAARKKLSDAYLFLRRTEHRLQMREDRQTHSLPAAPEDFAQVAAFMEYESDARFTADLKKHTGNVKKLYAEVFTESPPLSGPGNLVFTGVEDDPETLDTLKNMGFSNPAKITAAVRGWHHGRYRAVRSERARQLLTELVPHLLLCLSKTPHPDDAFTRFDRFLERLPAGVHIFSMLLQHPEQMELIADIMGMSPAMADFLGTHPEALDGVISREFFGTLPEVKPLEKELSHLLSSARGYEDMLDIARRFAREKRFHAGIHILRNLSPDSACRRYLSDIAEAALRCLLPHVENEFAKTHGVFKTGAYVILAMGSFAARQMFADSDLDIIALYQVAEKEGLSSGAKPLSPSVYYIRLTQRLIAAFSAPTAEGILYETDLRLRPDGNKGPLAVSMAGFLEYQRAHAWVWEHMSLIRARPVYGPTSVHKRLATAIIGILSQKRDTRALKAEMLEMREKIEQNFGSGNPWDLKYARGGGVDIMFAVHFLALKNGHRHGGLFYPDVPSCLAALHERKLLSREDFDVMSRMYETTLSVSGFLRLCAELPFNPATAPEGLKTALTRRLAPQATFQQYAKDIEQDRQAAFTVFRKIFGF